MTQHAAPFPGASTVGRGKVTLPPIAAGDTRGAATAAPPPHPAPPAQAPEVHWRGDQATSRSVEPVPGEAAGAVAKLLLGYLYPRTDETIGMEKLAFVADPALLLGGRERDARPL